MSLQTFLDAGAEPVAGTVYLNRQEMGRFYNGEFIVSPAGETYLATLAAAKPAAPPALPPEDPPAPVAPRPTRQKREQPAPPPPPAEPDISALIDA